MARTVNMARAATLPYDAQAFRVQRATHGAALAELAVDKTTAGESMHPFARVLVLRLLDGKKVWEGFADENGNWRADGLQPGHEYVAVGIDNQRVYKATAAGPVKATTEDA